MFELVTTVIILGLMRACYHWGRKDERRDNAVSAAQWVRRNHEGQ